MPATNANTYLTPDTIRQTGPDGSGNYNAPGQMTPVGNLTVSVSGGTNPTTLNTSTRFTFASTVRGFLIWNKSTTATIYFELDGAATVGSKPLGPGGLYSDPRACTTIDLYGPSVTVNGTSDGNVIIEGWN